MNDLLKGQNLIALQGETGGGAPIYAVNPACNDKLPPAYPAADSAQSDRALQAAWQAFLVYRETTREQRARFLDAIAEEIEALGASLIERAMQETALPQARLEGERARTCGQLRLFAQVLREGRYQDIRHDPALPDRHPLPRPDLRSRKIPLGVVAVFGASNFPLAFSVAGGDTASALAAGCPVVVKAHNAHPGTSEFVGRAVVAAARRCHMPEGVFALLYGNGHILGQQLAADPRIAAIGFTGSRQGGTALMATAARRPHPIPVYAEMSSVNPVYLMPAALAARGAQIGEALVQSMAMGAGQFCTSPGLVFAVAGQGFEDFLAAAQRALQALPAQTMLSAGIAEHFRQGVAELDSTAAVDRLASGQAAGINGCQAHLFVTDSATLRANPAIAGEVFGSSALIVRCRDIADMQAHTEALEGQLTAAIHSHADDDADTLRALISQLERKVGRILFNGFGTGVEVADAMVHGGPFPATSDGRSTSVGTAAIERFLRAVCYQNVPEALLPDDLR